MEALKTWAEFSPVATPYMHAAIPTETFLLGWKCASGAIAVADNGTDVWMLGDGDLTPLDYARALNEAAISGHVVASITIPTALAQNLKLENATDWVWMRRTRPFPVKQMPQSASIVSDNHLDGEIGRFLQLSAPDSSRKPGHPEINFWVTIRDRHNELAAVAAGNTWNSGAHVIVSVAVSPEHRRQGLGSLVTLIAGQQLFALGADSVALGVRGSNRGALDMYRTIGFDQESHFTSTRLVPNHD